MYKLISPILLIICSLAFAESKKVTIQTTHYPPYITVDSNKEVGGITYYIANEIFKSAGYKVTFNVVPYQRAVHNLFKSKDSVMTGVFAGIPNYKKIELTQVGYMNFPTTYFYNSKLHPEYSKITSLEQTKGKSVAVMGGTKVYEDVITNSGGRVLKLANEKQVFKMLKGGRVDFAHSALISSIQSISKDPKYKDLASFKFNVTNLISGLVFREGANSAKRDFIKEVQKLHKNGELLKIFKKALISIHDIDVKNLLPKEVEIKVNIPK